MKGEFEVWLVCLASMTVGGFFLYRSLRDVMAHVRKYRADKADNMVRWWYLEWVFILLDALFGTLTRPAVIVSLLFFTFGAIGLVVNTFSIIAGELK